MDSSQFGITFTDSRGPVNSDGPIHCICSVNRMVRYSVMPVCATAGPRGGFTHHHQPPTITTTATSPPAAPPAPPSPGLETHLRPLFRHSIRHHHHHWGLRHVSGLQFLFISFILFYTSQGPRRVLGPCLFYFILILFFLLHRD